MLWGYANGWFREYLDENAEDTVHAKLDFIRKWGFRETSVSLEELELFPQNGLDKIEGLRQAIAFLNQAHGAGI